MPRLFKKTGRPTKTAKPGVRASLGLKVTAEIKDRLDRAARDNGRTQSQEAEVRLERSFDREDLRTEALTLAHGPHLAGLLIVLGIVMQEAGRAADTLAQALDRHLVEGRPTPRQREALAATFEQGKTWIDSPYAYDQAVRAAVKILEAGRPEGDPMPPADSVAATSAAQGLECWSTSANKMLAGMTDGQILSGLSKTDADKLRALLGERIVERMKEKLK